MKKKKPIDRQRLIYAGPPLPQLGLVDRKVFHDGANMKAIDYIHKRWSKEIAQCKAFAELFIPLPEWPAVRRALNFDVARNVRGNSRHAVFYREVEKWRAKQPQAQKPSTIETHNA
jgi:hypothetical protein